MSRPGYYCIDHALPVAFDDVENAFQHALATRHAVRISVIDEERRRTPRQKGETRDGQGSGQRPAVS